LEGVVGLVGVVVVVFVAVGVAPGFDGLVGVAVGTGPVDGDVGVAVGFVVLAVGFGVGVAT